MGREGSRKTRAHELELDQFLRAFLPQATPHDNNTDAWMVPTMTEGDDTRKKLSESFREYLKHNRVIGDKLRLSDKVVVQDAGDIFFDSMLGAELPTSDESSIIELGFGFLAHSTNPKLVQEHTRPYHRVKHNSLQTPDLLHRFLILFSPADFRFCRWDVNGLIMTKAFDQSSSDLVEIILRIVQQNAQSLPKKCSILDAPRALKKKDLYSFSLAQSQLEMFPSIDPTTGAKAYAWLHPKDTPPQNQTLTQDLTASPGPEQIIALEQMLFMMVVQCDLAYEIARLGCKLSMTGGDPNDVILTQRRIKAEDSWYQVLLPLVPQMDSPYRRTETRWLSHPGIPLQSFESSWQFCRCLYVCICAHELAYKRYGVLHGDISMYTLNIVPPDSGFLLDWGTPKKQPKK